jgi:hypothetical protein
MKEEKDEEDKSANASELSRCAPVACCRSSEFERDVIRDNEKSA